MMPKKSKDGKVKTSHELETEYIRKVEHAVERLDTWSKKLAKLARSRKACLTEEERKTIAATVGGLADAVGEALTRPSTEEQPVFKLR